MTNQTWESIKRAVLGEKKKKTTRTKKVSSKLSKKDVATNNEEPYIEVISLDIDAKNPVQGNFELEWNSYFIAELKSKGFKGKNDEEIIDIWFQQICRNVALDEWENSPENPGPAKFVKKLDLGDGKTDVS